MLCVKNVSLRLPESRLLTNVNFTVDKGDIVTLMGPSGCGKSTLFSWMIGALAGQFSCTGELWLNEQRIDMLPTAQRQIGILSRMHCYLTSSASGKIYCWRYCRRSRGLPGAMP